MGTRNVLGAAVAGLSVLMAGCSSSSGTPVAEVSAPSETAASATPDGDLADFEAAVERTAAASQRSFTSLVRVTTSGGVVEVRLAGRRSGQDHMLTITTDQKTATYQVTGGSATLDRGQGPQPVALDEVPSAPSLRSLAQDLRDARADGPGKVVGTIDAAAVLGSDATPAGPVEARIAFEPGEFVQAFQLEAPDGSFTATVKLTDQVD